MKDVERELAVLRQVLGPLAVWTVEFSEGGGPNGAGGITWRDTSTVRVKDPPLVLEVSTDYEEGHDASTVRRLSAPQAFDPWPLLGALDAAGLYAFLDRKDPRSKQRRR